MASPQIRWQSGKHTPRLDGKLQQHALTQRLIAMAWGTDSLLVKKNDPITGVAAIGGPDTDLLMLSMRLPTNMTDLAPIITQQVEHE